MYIIRSILKLDQFVILCTLVKDAFLDGLFKRPTDKVLHHSRDISLGLGEVFAHQAEPYIVLFFPHLFSFFFLKHHPSLFNTVFVRRFVV